jgi:hypothetical protein
MGRFPGMPILKDKRRRGKVIPCFTSTAYSLRHVDVWGSGSLDPRIHDIATTWEVSGQLHVLAPLPPGKDSLVSIS